MDKAKVITICGSVKFMEEINAHTERLSLEGNCVLTVIPLTKGDYSQENFDILGTLHYQKIDMSDAIFVVNVNGYIGDSVRSEIEYAQSLNKEIIYLESPKEGIVL